jgi:hypothetical protein
MMWGTISDKRTESVFYNVKYIYILHVICDNSVSVCMKSESESYVTIDGQSASLSWCQSPIWSLRPDFITVRQLRVCWCEAPSLTRGRVCRLQLLLASPAQSFSGPSPLGLMTIFYCLRLETSLFVASYDSQGYGGGIRPRLHTGVSV